MKVGSIFGHVITMYGIAAVTALTGCAADKTTVRMAHLPSAHDGDETAMSTGVAYEFMGHGKVTLVFIHGWTCDRTFWHLQVPAVRDQYRLLLIDLPGHGESPASDAGYSMAFFAEAVRAVMDDAGERRAVLIGHSLGFPIAREFVRRYPDRAIALVSVDGSLIRPPASNAPADRETWENRIRGFIDDVTGPNSAARRSAFVDGMFSAEMPAELREAIKAKTSRTSDEVARKAMESIADPDVWREDVQALPVLAIVARDEHDPPDREPQWRRLFPQIEYQEWTGVGHFLMMERPEAFNRMLTAFLRQLPS